MPAILTDFNTIPTVTEYVLRRHFTLGGKIAVKELSNLLSVSISVIGDRSFEANAS